MSLVRYSRIESGMKREFLLLVGTGCRWARCTFCDYWNDRCERPYEVNREVLEKVSGEYGVLDVINSGSAMELDEETLSLIERTVVEKGIHDLWFEAAWMYHRQLEDFARRFSCTVHFRLGVESFNPALREKWKKGIPSSVTAEEIARYYDGVCLLAGTQEQSEDDIMESVRIAEKHFSYYSVNLFCNNTSAERRDEELCNIFVTRLAPEICKSPKAEVLIENTDLGVG